MVKEQGAERLPLPLWEGVGGRGPSEVAKNRWSSYSRSPLPQGEGESFGSSTPNRIDLPVYDFFTSPHVIDLVLALTVLEAGLLLLWRRRTRRGPSPLALFRMLLPGIFLLLGLRAALDGNPWPRVPVALTAALVAHLIDLQARWRG